MPPNLGAFEVFSLMCYSQDIFFFRSKSSYLLEFVDFDVKCNFIVLYPPKHTLKTIMEREVKPLCWRPKQTFIECLVRTKCYEDKGTIEDCIAANECFLERKNYTLCKMNSINPRYRLRGNPYDVATEDQKRLEARNERIANRELEQAGYVPEKKE